MLKHRSCEMYPKVYLKTKVDFTTSQSDHDNNVRNIAY